jgi:DNA-binding ferritin-like protein
MDKIHALLNDISNEITTYETNLTNLLNEIELDLDKNSTVKKCTKVWNDLFPDEIKTQEEIADMLIENIQQMLDSIIVNNTDVETFRRSIVDCSDEEDNPIDDIYRGKIYKDEKTGQYLRGKKALEALYNEIRLNRIRINKHTLLGILDE